MTSVRVGAQDGYDRLVIEFSGQIPGWSVASHSPSFEATPSANPVTLEGNGGVLVRIQPVAAWTSYRSPAYFHPRFPYLREAKLLENFEAVQQWGLGIQGAPCIRVAELESPARLVVDVYGA